MKNIFYVVLAVFVGELALAVTSSDISMLKGQNGFYVLQEAKVPETKRSLCSEGDLEFDEIKGTLILGATVLATDIYVGSPKHKENEEGDDCQEKSNSSFTKEALEFRMMTECPSQKIKSEVKRVLTFEKDILSYQQDTNYNGKKTSVTCVLKKEIKPTYPEIKEPEVEVEDVKE